MVELAQSYRITGSTAREIAASAERLIREGTLAPGDAVPTVRALAARLGASPATVSSAYRILRDRGLVVADGRRGTRVAPRPALRVPAAAGTTGAHDLTLGLPDPALLPALPAIELEHRLRFSELESDDPRLLAVARDWFAEDGVRADSLAVVSGAFDGIDRVLGAHLHPGDRVIVEDPAYSSIRDLLLARGLVAVPVPVDDRGLQPEPFAAALARGAHGLVVVPRAQNPFGAATDAERASELRGLLAEHPDILIVEDDHGGPVSGAPFATLVSPPSRRWVVIRATSKFLHPDLRLALMAGDDATIARVDGRRALGPRWVSHVLQALAAQLLGDQSFRALVSRASQTYAERRGALIDALASHGIVAHGRSGLNVWVPVAEEARAISTLLDQGWLALAGERFRLATPPALRVTIATLRPDEAGELAAALAAVESAGRPRRAY